MYTPVNPVLLYKSGVEEDQIYKGMFSWWSFCRFILKSVHVKRSEYSEETQLTGACWKWSDTPREVLI